MAIVIQAQLLQPLYHSKNQKGDLIMMKKPKIGAYKALFATTISELKRTSACKIGGVLDSQIKISNIHRSCSSVSWTAEINNQKYAFCGDQLLSKVDFRRIEK